MMKRTCLEMVSLLQPSDQFPGDIMITGENSSLC